MMERTSGAYPKSTQLIMDNAYNPDQLQMLKDQTKLGSIQEKGKKRTQKLLGQEPVVNLMNKLSGIKKPSTDRLME